MPRAILSTRATGSSALPYNTSNNNYEKEKLQCHCADRLEYKVPYVSKWFAYKGTYLDRSDC